MELSPRPRTIRNTGAECDNVLERTAQLTADDIRRGVHAEIGIIHERRLRQLSRRTALRSGYDSRRNAACNLLGVRRTGQCNDRIAAVHRVRDGLGEPAIAVLRVQTLADVDDNRMRRHDLRQLLAVLATAKDGTRQHDQIRFGSAGHVGRNLNTLRNDNTRQQLLVAALAVQQVTLLLQIGPRGYFMSVLVQQHRQCDAPAAGTQYKNLHVTSPLRQAMLRSSFCS